MNANLPTMTKVASSRIEEIGFDNRGLVVRFSGGALYRYPKAPKKVYEDAFQAESVGKWFGAEVKGRYDHIKIDG